ncbi:MAG: 2-oxo acid dehydrogenase subunit E2 [Clostridiales bacterium]|nr:2-oxo acid dehydrogenase subunit E2 [Clostridiales bacterium]
MAKAVVMPKVGITVESCIIGEWKKQPGDLVAVGDVLFDFETDKASFECESTEAGVLLEIFFGPGEEVPVLTNVCAIGQPGEDVSALRPASAKTAAGTNRAATGAGISIVTGQDRAEITGTRAGTPEATEVVPANTTRGGDIFRISPRARGLAERAGVDPREASGTGPMGRVIEPDMRRLMKEGRPEALKPVQPEGEYEEIKLTGIRRAIARAMKESLATTAQLTSHHSFDATGILRCRAEFKAAGGELAGVTLGDMVLFAVSRTLKSHPDLNATMPEEGILRRYRTVNLAVAVDTPRGLVVPVVFNADKKSLIEISKEVKELAAAARSGGISPDLLYGGSFTVSNLGALGVESFTPVLNPPQIGILGVCSILQRVHEREGGGHEFYPAMGLSLTYDHRAVDGAPAARFMQELCRNLENFTALLVRG